MPHAVNDKIREAVLGRLDLLDRAADADPNTLLPLARTEINRLADGWRRLLTAHQRDEEGRRCRACPTGLRGRRWPCPVWQTVYEHLIGERLPRSGWSRPLRSLFGRAYRAITGHRTRPATGGTGCADRTVSPTRP